jgi:carbonic anhydrase
MDARIDPAKIFGLTEGDAHVIRNAGGRVTDDAIRSLVISHKLLGTLDWFVIQHTCCGMALIDDETIGQLLADSLETAVYDGKDWSNPQVENSDNNKPGCDLGKHIDWYTFSDLRKTLSSDLAYVKNHPLVPSHIKVHGFIFDVKTGKLTPVVQ